MKDFIIVKKTKNKVEFAVDSEIYSLDSVKKTCFVFSDNHYALIKKKNKKTILVQMEVKDGADIKKIIGEFYNELLSNDLRNQVVKSNKNIRELILSRALYSAIDFGNQKKNKSKEKINTDDPLGIMTPWEEKYEKK